MNSGVFQKTPARMPQAGRDRARLPEGRHDADYLMIQSIVGDTVRKSCEHRASFFWNEFFVTFLPDLR